MIAVEPAPTWLARNGLKLLAYFLAIIALWLGTLQVLQWREDAATGAERIEARDRTAEAAGGIASDVTAETTERQAVEVRVVYDTRQYRAALEQSRNENPALDDFLRQPWPVELQQLARARREARDRLGSAAPGSAGTDPGAPAAGSGDPSRGRDQR